MQPAQLLLENGNVFSQCCNYFVSDLQKSINATTTSDAGYNPNGTLKPWAILAQNKTWNNFANNIVFSPAVDVAGAAVGIGELSRGLRSVSNLLKAGNIIEKDGFSAAGKALQSHGDRIGSAFPNKRYYKRY